MHVCLFHIYDHAFTLFILIVIYPRELVMIMYEQRYLNKDRTFVMLTSSTRLYHVFMFNSSRIIFKLLTDSLLLLYVILIGFLAVNTELSGTTRQVPCFI
jgi:hypothetical protein